MKKSKMPHSSKKGVKHNVVRRLKNLKGENAPDAFRLFLGEISHFLRSMRLSFSHFSTPNRRDVAPPFFHGYPSVPRMIAAASRTVKEMSPPSSLSSDNPDLFAD